MQGQQTQQRCQQGDAVGPRRQTRPAEAELAGQRQARQADGRRHFKKPFCFRYCSATLAPDWPPTTILAFRRDRVATSSVAKIGSMMAGMRGYFFKAALRIVNNGCETSTAPALSVSATSPSAGSCPSVVYAMAALAPLVPCAAAVSVWAVLPPGRMINWAGFNLKP